ncbi:gas vesicle protein [Pseudomonas sp. TNT2022 ID357]|uniref:Gas vesicle protein n=1 Tax=Pseudomonas idahonensis TaxID=2942628 RepID=A0ABT5Q750_9PSED|nr:gas vesicle accessory protein GvpU [Pseudomonas idahonensis]MDD1150026.1 gas vesicle protein [Pseudomonas idahonensis]
MTDPNSGTYENELSTAFRDDLFTKAQWEGRKTDWLIQWFAKFVNSSDSSVKFEVPLTLTVGGNLVSGTLISEADYFDLLAADFSRSFTGSVKEAAEEMIKGLQPLAVVDGEDDTYRQFVHMKNAQVFTSASGPITTQGALWRGKISSVEGFSLGSIISN